MTPDLNDIRVFVEVARRGSFIRAAETLDMPPSTVSRKVAHLEQVLGTALLVRTTRRLHLTPQGQRYFERCALGMAELQAAADTVRQDEPQGHLRLTASVPIGLHWVQPWLQHLQQRYPQISVDLYLDNRYVDLLGEGFDLAFRGGPLKDSSLKARRIKVLAYQLAASPAYVARCGAPHSPADLADHACIGVASDTGQISWELLSASGERWRQPISGPLRTNSVEAAIQAAQADQGILYLPTLFMQTALAQGALLPLLPQWCHLERELYAVYAPHPQMRRPLQALLQALPEL